MLVSTRRQSYDGKFRLVLYRPDAGGRIESRLEKSDFDEEIDSVFALRAVEYERLLGSMLEGRLSPVGFWLEFRGMSAADVALRPRIPRSKVERHATWEGWRSATVQMLALYAKVFDVDVADFFQFGTLDDGIEVEIEIHEDRLLQQVRIRKAAP